MTDREATHPLLAADAYAKAQLVTRDLLERLEEMVFCDMPQNDGGLPIHWGDVGDLNEVNYRLSQLMAFVGGKSL